MEHNEFFKNAKKIRMRQEEKALVCKALLSYMEQHPVRFGAYARHQFQRSWFQQWISIINLHYKPMAIALVLLVAIATGGGVSLAAENALPGDVLYPVKVGVNENVRATFAFSQEAKAEWKAEQAERRLKEAETLAIQGEFDARTAANIATRFEQHTQRLADIAAKLEEKGNVEAAAAIHSSLEARLEAHNQILADIHSDGGNGGMEELLAKVRAKAETVKTARMEAEAEVAAKGPEVRVAAEGKLDAAQNKIAEVRKFIEGMEARLGASAATDAHARLKAAEDIVAEGEVRAQAGAYGEAFVLFQEAMRVAQEAKALVQIGADLNIQIGGEPETEDKSEAEEEAAGEEKEEQETETEGNIEVELETEVEVEL